MVKLVVQIPCYNEEETIAQTLGDIPRAIPGIDEVEVLIINDGSTDDTVKAALAAGADHVIGFAGNKGLAAAFAAGLEAAVGLGADIIVNTAADNQYKGECIPGLVAPIRDGEADIVVGVRPIDEIADFSWAKKKLQKLGSWVVRQVSGTKVSDATSGFRAYSRDAAQRLTVISGFTYTHETLIQAGRSNMIVGEVPIEVNAVSRPSRLFKSIPEYLRRSLGTILRIYALYEPLAFFTWAGAVLLTIAAIIGSRFLYFFLVGNGAGHIQSLIFASVLAMMGFQMWVLGIVADLVAANRKLVQEALYRLKRDTGRQSPGNGSCSVSETETRAE